MDEFLVEQRFTYHPPKESYAERYVEIRSYAKTFAILLTKACPDSRELSHALNKLDETVMWANAAIARNG